MITGAALVYLLCLATCLVCTVLLAQAYRRTRASLLLWSAVCFGFLALNNLLVVLDMVVTGDSMNLSFPRALAGLAAVGVLLYGFIWKVRP
jgi:hypothetical protein